MASFNTLTIQFRRRFSKQEVLETVYQSAYEVLCKLPQPWGLDGVPMKSLPNYQGQISTGVSYTKQLKASPIKNFGIGFFNRNRRDEPPDESSYDDTMTVGFYVKKVDQNWKYLFSEVFPTYIQAFKPYVGELTEDRIFSSDIGSRNFDTGEIYRNPDFIDSRQGVCRIWPVNYWDRELCHKAFQLTPGEIVNRLAGKVAECREFENGVLLIYSYEPPTVEQILQINPELMPILRD
ncbi:hypothetical protein ACO0LM_20435 [Undibacterium sp. Di26W]|uniref:hypothetical protein n=1 Tax=Undibacterium sp. Di26W TaxID=3413035 RepID=UPI003BF12009